MSDKEEEQFASAMLLIAVAVYVAVVSALFAGMLVVKPDAASALAGWAKDYGAIIAGVPVLIAVLLAKQQLDANRRQHVAMIKRSFREEIEAAEQLTQFFQQVKKINSPTMQITYALAGIKNPKIHPPSESDIERWSLKFSDDVRVMAINSRSMSLHFNKYSLTGEQVMATQTLDSASASAEIALELIEERMSRLSEYWS